MNQKAKILDLAMNLNRIGNWAADGYKLRQKRILFFLDDSSSILKQLEPATFSPPFRKMFERFLREYPTLQKIGKTGPKDESEWAEQMMTWGNILTHRSKFITE